MLKDSLVRSITQPRQCRWTVARLTCIAAGLGWTYTVRSVGCGLAIGWRAFWTVSMLMPGSFEQCNY
jgi:hypothetical protein